MDGLVWLASLNENDGRPGCPCSSLERACHNTCLVGGLRYRHDLTLGSLSGCSLLPSCIVHRRAKRPGVAMFCTSHLSFTTVMISRSILDQACKICITFASIP